MILMRVHHYGCNDDLWMGQRETEWFRGQSRSEPWNNENRPDSSALPISAIWWANNFICHFVGQVMWPAISQSWWIPSCPALWWPSDAVTMGSEVGTDVAEEKREVFTRVVCAIICAGLNPLHADFGLTLIPAWISNNMPSKVWDEITYLFPNFNSLAGKVLNFINFYKILDKKSLFFI